ncbi:MAG: hypothetical protein L0Z62_03945 [Gemmataceae bacterium]|nr:hypothetical protein [Gemmataceae bacterium]
MNAVDTNVFVYALDGSGPVKQAKAPPSLFREIPRWLLPSKPSTKTAR